AHWFYACPCKALVLACNTATAAAADAARQRWVQWPIVGIEPAVKPAAMLTRTGQVGILATSSTLASCRFQRLVERFDTVTAVHPVPCPGLVDLVEQATIAPDKVRALLKPKIAQLLQAGVDVIVLGCTHYPFVADVVAELAGPGVQIVETGEPVARQLQRVCSLTGRLWSCQRAVFAGCPARQLF
ncbi:MAG: glutamate racemase, partial [Limnobacter sp.]|nr:glutamate racemase [Limnobacter sp.]